MEKVGAVECFAVGLVHCDHVFLSIKYLNLLLNVILYEVSKV